MGRDRKFVVWTWLYPNGSPAYVGWGEFKITHPAKAVWASRAKYDSELNDWLQTLEAEPRRDEETVSIELHKSEARAIAQAKRMLLRAKKENILESRPRDSYAGGGGPRQVLGPDLTIYSSVRAAATDYGVNPSTVTRWLRANKDGWSYVS